MEINELSAFLAVAETGSFSQAAEQLYLTQPAVSKRVAALESRLGVRLFDRIGHRINLTEAGRQLRPRAHDLLDEISDIHRSLSNLSGEVSGTLRMGTSHHIGLHRLPPILRRFRRDYSQVRLDIRFLDSEAGCDAVESGELELAVVTLPTTPSPKLRLREIWPDPLAFMVARDHPLAQDPHPAPERLTAYPALLPGSGTYTRNILEQALAPLGLEIEVAIATNYLETLRTMVAAGLGWSLLPRTMLDNREVRALEIPGLNLTRTLGLVTHGGRSLSNAARAMIAICEQSAAEG
jgi:DNA-binding transcriptional LysR family regulator